MSNHSPRRIQKVPPLWVSLSISVCVGLVLAIISNLLGGTRAISLSNAIGGIVCSVIIAEIYTRNRLDANYSLIKDITCSQDLERLVTDARDAFESIRKQSSSEIRMFLTDRFSEGCTDMIWRDLVTGKLTIDAERELSFNRDALSICKRKLRAVSYQDDAFWKSAEGIKFLQAHQPLVNGKCEVVRLFLLEGSRPTEEQISMMKKQESLGINVLVVPSHSTDADDMLDFVLYDDVAVRRAEAATGLKKRAVLLTDRSDVLYYEKRFENLIEKSIPFASFLAEASEVSEK